MATTSQPGVVSFEEAREIIREYCARIPPPLTQEISLMGGLGRVLAKDVLADRDFPPFPRSTRDGYAVRAADLAQTPASLRVVGQVKAGSSFNGTISAGEAVEIMTGAPVPAGADAVVMLEYTSPCLAAGNDAGNNNPPGEIMVERSVSPGENVVAAGSEARA